MFELGYGLLLALSAGFSLWSVIKGSWGWLLLAGFMSALYAVPFSNTMAAVVALASFVQWTMAVLWGYRRGRTGLSSVMLWVPALMLFYKYVDVYSGWLSGSG